MHTQQSLQTLRVPQLKALCKELKVLNYSKLGKADLVNRIIEAGRTASKPNSTFNALQSSQDKRESSPQHCDSSSKRSGDVNPLLAPASKKIKTKSKELTNSNTKTKIKTTDQANSNVQAKAFNQKLIEPTQINDNVSNVAPVQPSNGISLNPPAINRVVTIKTPIINATLSLSRKINTNKKFVPLKVTDKIPQPNLINLRNGKEATGPHVDESDHFTESEDRLRWMKDHFIERLFLNLNRTRIRPITRPPYPSLFPSNECASAQDLAFQGLNPTLYSTADAATFKVALRFWLARLHTMSQLGSTEAWAVDGKARGLLGPDLTTWPAIKSCQAVSKDVWSVVTINDMDHSDQKYFLVMGNTGDVISCTDTPHDDTTIRSDWAAYMRQEGPHSVSDCVKTKDDHASPGGISREWLKRTDQTRASQELREIARRAVLDSCSLNSASGSKLSVSQMEAEWLGNAQPRAAHTTLDRLEFFLPESQQVLSVHIPPPPYHSALAIVTRSSGESVTVLRETGQVVGHEGCGIVELWQGLLGCDENGMKDESGAEAFWNGWEERINAGCT